MSDAGLASTVKRNDRISQRDIDSLLAAQLIVAWAGEKGDSEDSTSQRLGWWQTNIVGEGAEYDLKELLPNTWRWAMLNAVRHAAKLHDASVRAKDLLPRSTGGEGSYNSIGHNYMTTMTHRDIQHIFESLRKGLVPERGIDAFVVGIEKLRGEMDRQLELARNGEGTIKFLRGGYGCGKTFMARLTLLDAHENGFVTSFVVVSDNDLRFHRFDDVYRKVMIELGTNVCPRGAMGDILDRWIAKVEDALIAGGEDEDADDFDQKVRKRIDEDLAALTGGKAPQDFVRVTQTIFDLKQVGNLVDAGSLISWLCGSGNVAANPKKLAGVSYSVIYRPSIAIANSKRKFRINATTKHETRRLESPIPRPVGSSIVILVSTSTPSSHV